MGGSDRLGKRRLCCDCTHYCFAPAMWDEVLLTPLVHALREGHWILLDEMNLAAAETLERVAAVLEEGGSVALTERGEADAAAVGAAADELTTTLHGMEAHTARAIDALKTVAEGGAV